MVRFTDISKEDPKNSISPKSYGVLCQIGTIRDSVFYEQKIPVMQMQFRYFLLIIMNSPAGQIIYTRSYWQLNLLTILHSERFYHIGYFLLKFLKKKNSWCCI